VTDEDEAALLDFTWTDAFWHPLLMVAFDSGVREGELFGLQKLDVLETGELWVRRSVDTIKGQPVVKEALKTDSSRRKILLSQDTLDALAPLLRQITASDGHLFTEAGDLFTRHRFYDRWQALLKRADLTLYTFNACRHRMATALLKGGAYLVAVSKRLGHSKPTVTLNVYADYLPVDQHGLATAFSARLKVQRGPVESRRSRQWSLTWSLNPTWSRLEPPLDERLRRPYKRKSPLRRASFLVRETGLEPARPCGR
jgi:integrase